MPARGLQDLSRRTARYACGRQLAKSLDHCVTCVLGSWNSCGRAPGPGGEMLRSRACIPDNGTHLFGGNTQLAAHSVGEGSADALPHLMGSDTDHHSAVIPHLEMRNCRHYHTGIGTD